MRLTMPNKPTPEQIRAARMAAGLTQSQSAELVGLSHENRWQEYEAGRRSPSRQTWELFLERTRQPIPQPESTDHPCP